MDTRECKECGIVQAVTDFPIREVSKKTGKTLYRYKCRPCDNKRTLKWQRENREKMRAITARWAEENREKQRELNRLWQKNNREKANQIKSNWARNNPEKVREQWSRRRAAKLRRTPIWADQVKISYVYHAAQVIKDVYGTLWEVDHILPLQGDTVSGFHVPNNLQILPMRQNRRKSNKFEAA